MLRKRKQSQTQNSENVANVSNTKPQGNLGMNAGPLNQARSSRNRTAKVTYDPSTENGCPSSRSPDPLAQGRLAASRRGNSSPSPSRQNQQADENPDMFKLAFVTSKVEFLAFVGIHFQSPILPSDAENEKKEEFRHAIHSWGSNSKAAPPACPSKLG
jgi:hypothetical protein